MTSFEYPEMRWDLTDAVEQLALPKDALTLGSEAIRFAISILLDDFTMDVERPQLIGAFLMDEEEMRVAAKVSLELKAILLTLKPTDDVDDFRRHPRWPSLVKSATQLLSLLYRDCAGHAGCPNPAFKPLTD